MLTRDWDTIEKRAADTVAHSMTAGADLEGVPADQLPKFILWIVQQFSESMRAHVENGGAPF